MKLVNRSGKGGSYLLMQYEVCDRVHISGLIIENDQYCTILFRHSREPGGRIYHQR